MKNVKKLMYWMLLLLVFTLPLAEGIKNIALVLFIVFGVYGIYSKEVQIKLDSLNILVILIPVLVFIGSFVGIDTMNSLKGLNSIVTMSIMFIFVRELALTDRQIKYLFFVMFIGFLVTLLWGYYEHYVQHTRFLELHSVGHVNHSSIYMLLIFVMSLVYGTMMRKYLTYREEIFLIFVAVASIVSVFITGSRATMYTGLGILGLYSIYSAIKIDKRFLFALIFMGIAVFTLFFFHIDDRMIAKFHRGFNDPARWELIHTFMSAWKDHNMIFGIGINNCGAIDLGHYGGKILTHVSHAHNTYITYLTERGLVGVGVYILFLFFILLKFMKGYLSSDKQTMYVMALLIWIINFVISFANTTFHHENAILMLIVWAIAIGISKNEKTPLHSGQ